MEHAQAENDTMRVPLFDRLGLGIKRPLSYQSNPAAAQVEGYSEYKQELKEVQPATLENFKHDYTRVTRWMKARLDGPRPKAQVLE